jgi:hypothetical protein
MQNRSNFKWQFASTDDSDINAMGHESRTFFDLESARTWVDWLETKRIDAVHINPLANGHFLICWQPNQLSLSAS